MNSFTQDFPVLDFAKNEEILTAEEYLRLFANFKDKIKTAVIIPPELGKNGFGAIKVTYKDPTFRLKDGR